VAEQCDLRDHTTEAAREVAPTLTGYAGERQVRVFETDEIAAIRQAAAEFAEDRYAPLADEWDAGRVLLPVEERKRIASLGYLGIALPEKYGGAAAPLLHAVVALEEFGKRNLAAAWAVFEANMGPIRTVEILGDEPQKEFYLNQVISGEGTMAIAISEPEAGSAATDMTTTARVAGETVTVTGVKRWCSGAGHSEFYLVYARMPDSPGGGLGAVIVHKDDPGVEFGARERLHGFSTVATADIVLDEVRIPASRIVVPGGGFAAMMRTFSMERVGNATMSLAAAQASFDRAVQFVTERQQFGRHIIDFQAVYTRLANMAVEIEAARLLVHQAASAAETTQLTRYASLAKLKANRVGVQVSGECMELMGGYGYHRDYQVERLHRDAHGWLIAGGTPTMQETRIATELFGRKFPQRQKVPPAPAVG
jgi:alkylation response protein AidB-like acyl-CoA dehydrogenase